MMATKPTTSLRDGRISPSPARSSPRTSLSRGDNTSPRETKPEAVPSSKFPTRRIPIIPTINTSATSKTPPGRRLAEKGPSPSASSLHRSLKPATPTRIHSGSSMLDGDKSAQTASRTARASLVPKAKSTSSKLAKKKETPATIAVLTSEGKISSEPDGVTALEKPVEEQLWNNHKEVVEALNEVKNVEESMFIRSLAEEENHIEDQKNSGESQSCGQVLLHQVFDEVSKESVMLEEDPQQARSAMPAAKKKGAPISNEVIEETKSKLMGTKNKVLALVGAFETVISLRESDGQQIQKALHVQHGQ